MFENRYNIAYKLLMVAILLLALYSMVHPGLAETLMSDFNTTGTSLTHW